MRGKLRGKNVILRGNYAVKTAYYVVITWQNWPIMRNYAAEFSLKALKQVKPLVITITMLIALYNKVIMNTIARIDGPFNEKLIQRANTTCAVAVILMACMIM